MLKHMIKKFMFGLGAIGIMFLSGCAFVAPMSPALVGGHGGYGNPTPTPSTPGGLNYGTIDGMISNVGPNDYIAISVVDALDSNVYTSTTRYGNGAYTVLNVVPGTYTADAYNITTGIVVNYSSQITVTAGQTQSGIDFAF